jgi:hypothetical protein
MTAKSINICVIVEGKSESIFIKRVLSKYFLHYNSRMVLHVIQNETSSGYYGGVVNYAKLVDNIDLQLRLPRIDFVTTFIDFYGLSTIDYPLYLQIINQFDDPYLQVLGLEDVLLHSVLNSENFIPYIQLHEFEAFYFADYERFLTIDNSWTHRQRQKILEIVNAYPNPELINNGYKTAPSKRLRNILHYNKIKHANMYQEAVRGQSVAVINHMRYKCQHFNQWIKKLLDLSNRLEN